MSTVRRGPRARNRTSPPKPARRRGAGETPDADCKWNRQTPGPVRAPARAAILPPRWRRLGGCMAEARVAINFGQGLGREETARAGAHFDVQAGLIAGHESAAIAGKIGPHTGSRERGTSSRNGFEANADVTALSPETTLTSRRALAGSKGAWRHTVKCFLTRSSFNSVMGPCATMAPRSMM